MSLVAVSTAVVGFVTVCGIGAYLMLTKYLDCDWELFWRANVPLNKTVYSGKRVVIVGASSGIGEHLAYAFAERGANLVLAARRTDKLEKVAQQCRRSGSPETVVRFLDVTQFDSHKKFVEEIIDQQGAVDILVNNAGRTQRSLTEETELGVDRNMFDLNVTGTLSITKAFLPVFLQRGQGTILVTSSIAGKLPAPISSTYAATKHALQGFFNSLRTEVGSRNIGISLACPGPVKSEITQHAFVNQADKEFGESCDDDSSRMESRRCAELMLKCVYHGQYECWIAAHPFLTFTYLFQYMPTLATFMSERIVGPKRVAAFKQNDVGYGSLTNVFSSMFKGGKTGQPTN